MLAQKTAETSLQVKEKVAGQKNWGEGIIAITFVGKSQALFKLCLVSKTFPFSSLLLFPGIPSIERLRGSLESGEP